jgi:CheY-like chemotaxis protein
MRNETNAPIANPGFILIADDDLDDLELLGEAFHSLDSQLRVEFIYNGNKLINYLEKLGDAELPSILVLDYNIPELNGVEIIRTLNKSERYQAIPKVIWSTSNSAIHKKLSVELGATDYIVKPSDLASFNRIAKYLLSLINKEEQPG